MPNEPSDLETPATSSARRTGRASPWSKEDMFKLLEGRRCRRGHRYGLPSTR
ncbi:hypothetical protein E4U60_007956 [Claviceps pazoutovae]|uniref:Uncharacterized protein n=1 Tax=Claviceps pazoutovae TaxID=1649127 RepID=A0A9P7SC50_9HYPO|nr:hypothetical protein E4U60_007956 [Claviceps pazoutovae]